MSTFLLNVSETLDGILDGRASVIQKKDGYRFSMDSLLLAGFFQCERSERVIDLGSGCGVIPIVLIKKMNVEKVHGLEVQEDLVNIARRSIVFNDLQNRVEILHGDVKRVEEIFQKGSFDHVITNPPYRKVKTGRINPSVEKAIARHEILATLEDFIGAAYKLLREGGKITLIYSVERGVDIVYTLRAFRLEPKRLRLVYSCPQANAAFILIEAVKGGGVELKIEPSLFIYKDDGSYSDEVKTLIY
ncbi:MAG: tRNA1(Val) (adenine(37)-N6)-methyltransferase [Thermodesulfobacteriota bacterium]|nr:tRNA1(Val) (adenine(37)-N6)-methyltransferase [Thermodesulfobacteriota bacterium]